MNTVRFTPGLFNPEQIRHVYSMAASAFAVMFGYQPRENIKGADIALDIYATDDQGQVPALPGECVVVEDDA